MKYYIVMNEWLYPTESGREYIGDYDTLAMASAMAHFQYEKELPNFLEVNQEIYTSGETVDSKGECDGYIIYSSQYEEENMFFRSVIIKREIP